MSYTNKILALILVISLVFATISILLNLGILGSLKSTSNAISEGFVSFEIGDRLSITTADGSAINFGACNLLGVDFNITSENTKNTSHACRYFFKNNISTRNNGNIPATVKIKSNAVGAARGGTFLESPSARSDVAYKISNAGRGNNTGGCLTGIGPANYTPFLAENEDYLACEYLAVGPMGGANSIVTNFEILVPGDIEAGFTEVIITFTAEEYVEP